MKRGINTIVNKYRIKLKQKYQFVTFLNLMPTSGLLSNINPPTYNNYIFTVSRVLQKGFSLNYETLSVANITARFQADYEDLRVLTKDRKEGSIKRFRI